MVGLGVTVFNGNYTVSVRGDTVILSLPLSSCLDIPRKRHESLPDPEGSFVDTSLLLVLDLYTFITQRVCRHTRHTRHITQRVCRHTHSGALYLLDKPPSSLHVSESRTMDVRPVPRVYYDEEKVVLRSKTWVNLGPHDVLTRED